MGKNVLESPGVVLGNPSALLRIVLVLVASLAVMAADADTVATLDNLLKLMNMTRIPHVSQWNISQTEYETKHREYFDLVEQNQRRRLNSSANYDEENIVRKKLYTFTHSGLKNSPSSPSGLLNLNYDVHIPEESNKRTEVEETSLRLLIVPRNCATHRRRLTLEVGRADWDAPAASAAASPRRPPATTEVFLDECLPKWVAVDLTAQGMNAAPSAGFRVSVRCADCPRRDVRLAEPHLNVIVEVKARVRRRRADRKKRKRFPGKCVRHPWEVDLGKLKGYEYIVQPRKFDAGLCAGKCTGQWNLANQHSNLQYLFSNIDKTIPKPCCAPSKMESLEILYPDEDNPKKLKVSVWNDTKIVECACS